jgi:hypothetical protein
LGRVLFAAKAELTKVEPAINWSEIESRLQEISPPARAPDISADPAVPIASDPPATAPSDDSAVTLSRHLFKIPSGG